MQPQNEVVRAVIKRFPDHTQDIIRLFVENESFREICEDFVTCLSATKRMGKPRGKRSQTLREYQNALDELEAELLKNLRAQKTSE